jgi:hypothetical protein
MADFGTELGALREKQSQARQLLMHLLTDEESVQVLDTLAIQRWEEGRAVYEDRAWHKTNEELLIDINEELADAINYAAVWLLQYSPPRGI